MLKILTATVKGRQENLVADLVDLFRTAQVVCVVLLVSLREEQIILSLKYICVQMFNDSGCKICGFAKVVSYAICS